jgi:hypothetical protein
VLVTDQKAPAAELKSLRALGVDVRTAS